MRSNLAFSPRQACLEWPRARVRMRCQMHCVGNPPRVHSGRAQGAHFNTGAIPKVQVSRRAHARGVFCDGRELGVKGSLSPFFLFDGQLEERHCLRHC